MHAVQLLTMELDELAKKKPNEPWHLIPSFLIYFLGILSTQMDAAGPHVRF